MERVLQPARSRLLKTTDTSGMDTISDNTSLLLRQSVSILSSPSSVPPGAFQISISSSRPGDDSVRTSGLRARLESWQ